MSRRVKGEGFASRRAFNEGVNGKSVEFIYIVQTSLMQLSQTLLVGAAYPTVAGLTTYSLLAKHMMTPSLLLYSKQEFLMVASVLNLVLLIFFLL